MKSDGWLLKKRYFYNCSKGDKSTLLQFKKRERPCFTLTKLWHNLIQLIWLKYIFQKVSCLFFFSLTHSWFIILLVSGVQKSDSVIHHFFRFFHYVLLQNIEYSHLHYTVICFLSILCTVVCICKSHIS